MTHICFTLTVSILNLLWSLSGPEFKACKISVITKQRVKLKCRTCFLIFVNPLLRFPQSLSSRAAHFQAGFKDKLNLIYRTSDFMQPQQGILLASRNCPIII